MGSTLLLKSILSCRMCQKLFGHSSRLKSYSMATICLSTNEEQKLAMPYLTLLELLLGPQMLA